MDYKTFEKIVDDQVNICKDLLLAKGLEYSPGADALSNFKTSAILQKSSWLEALSGYMAKHTISLYDMLNSPDTFSMEKWDEKITDHMNYLFLLKALLVEPNEDPTDIIPFEIKDTNA